MTNRTMTTSESVFSAEMIIKVIKAMATKYPTEPQSRIAALVLQAFREKVAATAEKVARLQKLSSDLQALANAETLAIGIAKVFSDSEKTEVKPVSFAPVAKAAVVKKIAAKANGKTTIAAQTALAV